MATSSYKIKRRRVKQVVKSAGLPNVYFKNINQIMPFVRGASQDWKLKGVPPMSDSQLLDVTLVALTNIINYDQHKVK